jgi:DNA-binding transcriptional regulator GbsR (MarR family)
MKEEKSLHLGAGKQKFVEKLGYYYESYGIPRIGGKMIALLQVSGRALSAEEMANTLKVSRSSVSTNIRLLVLYKFVEAAPGQDSRTDYFTLAADAWDNAIIARIEGFQNLKAITEQCIATLEEGDCANEKLQDMASWAAVMIEGHEKTLEEWQRRKKR